MAELRLNIGAGGTVLEGFTPIDIKAGTDARRLPYEDNSVEEVYASHVAEHFGGREFPAVLREWVRVLKPGGRLRVAVPDLKKLAREIADATDHGREDYCTSVLYGGQIDEHDRHGWGYSERTLRAQLHAAGLGSVGPFEAFADDCSKNPYSLNMEGHKRWWDKVERPKVAFILVQPRLGFTGHAVRCMEMAYAIGRADRADLEIQQSWGAFWDRDIEAATQLVIEKYDPDFILYSDFDGYFQPQDVFDLIDTVNANPTLAGAGAVQMSRHNDFPLVYRPDLDYTSDLTRVPFSHFGLTVLRADVFRELPHPWFWSIPGDDGSWGHWRRSDADITFWRILGEHGFNFVQHNKVVVGHGQWCVKWPKADGSGVILQPEEAYFSHGKPEKATFDGKVYREKMAKQAEAGA